MAPLKPVPAAVGGAALIKIAAPAGAEVYVEKERVSGDVFQTPPLEGRMKVYSVRAKWLKDGREVEQFRVVGVEAGETAKLTFTSASASRPYLVPGGSRCDTSTSPRRCRSSTSPG